MATKYVYLFRDGDASMRDLLGGKGAGAGRDDPLGLPVPPGFTITTEACNAYYDSGEQFPDGMWEQVLDGAQGRRAADRQAVRRSRQPAAGLGALGREVLDARHDGHRAQPGPERRRRCEGLATLTGNPRFADDAYRRFVQLFGKIVLGVDGEKFEHVMDEAKGHGQRQDTDLTRRGAGRDRRALQADHPRGHGRRFPRRPDASSCGWRSTRSSARGTAAARVDYRRLNKIADDLGTGVNVQTMVFGNMGND